MLRLLAAAPRRLTPLALGGAVLALLLPSSGVAGHSDLLLALLVLATALGISLADLRRLRRHARDVAVLSLAPLVVLTGAAWLVGQPFSAQVRHGLLAVGLSSSEVASVGLVTLAGADATIALGAVTGHALIGVLAGGAAQVSSVSLLGRFALVVILPLALGVAVRSMRAAAVRLQELDEEREGVAALAVVALVYAALSGTQGAHHLGAAVAASGAFLLVSALLAGLWLRLRTG